MATILRDGNRQGYLGTQSPIVGRPCLSPIFSIINAWNIAWSHLGTRRLAALLSGQRGFSIVEMISSIAIVAIVAAIAVPTYQKNSDRAQLIKCVADIGAISLDVQRYATINRVHPNSLADIGRSGMLDPWGNPYQYVNHDDKDDEKHAGNFRRDKNVVSINTDFDVFSKGKDRDSSPALAVDVSRDDIVRAGNGAFIGIASEYDP